MYGKCSKIVNTFPFLFSNKLLVYRADIQNASQNSTNREDPDQTAFSEAVWSGSVHLFWTFFVRQLEFKISEHLPHVPSSYGDTRNGTR